MSHNCHHCTYYLMHLSDKLRQIDSKTIDESQFIQIETIRLAEALDNTGHASNVAHVLHQDILGASVARLIPLLQFIINCLTKIQGNVLAWFEHWLPDTMQDIYESLCEKEESEAKIDLSFLRMEWNDSFSWETLSDIDNRLHKIDVGWPIIQTENSRSKPSVPGRSKIMLPPTIYKKRKPSLPSNLSRCNELSQIQTSSSTLSLSLSSCSLTEPMDNKPSLIKSSSLLVMDKPSPMSTPGLLRSLLPSPIPSPGSLKSSSIQSLSMKPVDNKPSTIQPSNFSTVSNPSPMSTSGSLRSLMSSQLPWPFPTHQKPLPLQSSESLRSDKPSPLPFKNEQSSPNVSTPKDTGKERNRRSLLARFHPLEYIKPPNSRRLTTETRTVRHLSVSSNGSDKENDAVEFDILNSNQSL